ncbi:MAG: transcriptional regulator [Rhodobacteraceae bacterium]|nr:transcriptional regulator [Paracoccaceae bacterium]MAY47236.1 transcriptional regulator [Paracoccaceae bacterium]QEW22322.1 transcriptional regulator BetI [Marinibacterium anthonyi]
MAAARDTSDDKLSGNAPGESSQTHSRDPKRNRRLLVQATLDSVAEDGITDTTVSAIIKRAGLSRGMIHLHFGGKDGLLVAAAEAFSDCYFEEMQRQLARAGDTPEAVITAVIRADLSPEIMNERAVAIWHGFRGESRTNTAIARYSDTRDMRLRETIFRAFLALLDGDSHTANEVTLGTLAMMEGMWTDYLTHPDRFSRDTAVRIIMRFLGGVVPGHFRIDPQT